MLDTVGGAKYFTSLDLTSGYWQIRVSDEDIPKTAFRTPFGHFQWKLLPFGLSNAPATFQSVMNDIFRPYLRDFVVVYLDDILIFSKTEEEHKRHVRLVLEILRKERFYVCKAKSSFNQTETKFLGHIVGTDGVKPDPQKVEAVRNWSEPKDVHHVRSFLGLANYFLRFMQGYATLAQPLTHLTKSKVKFEWTPRCQEAFDGIKDCLIRAPCLASPDVNKPYTVVSDASTVGIGAVLLQDERPIAFTSRKLSPPELNYSTGEQELLAVVHALNVWRCYLEGPQFTVVTDHCPNTFLQTQQNLSRRQARWSEFLQRFNFTWSYREGRTNVADPLSRNPVSPTLALLTAAEQGCEKRGQRRVDGQPSPATPPSGAWKTRYSSATFSLPSLLRSTILEAYTTDEWLRDANSQDSTRLSANPEGFFLKENRIYVPANDLLKRSIMHELHDSPYVGHGGEKKTLRAIERLFWWPDLRSDVHQYVSTCTICQRNKPRARKPGGLLHPIEILERPWESISFDLITDLPVAEGGHDAIIVFVD
jgi:hypothetical protein